jgi:tripartite-type tricarboxylate transporter receptor subunit TctC
MRNVLPALFLAGLSLLPASRAADDATAFPTKPVRVVVPYPAGSIVDVRARWIAERLMKNLGKPVIVDNRPGASTVIGADAVAKSPPDGYTLLMTGGNTFVTNPALMSDLPFDPVKDFTPLTPYSRTPVVLAVHPSLGVKSVAEFITLVKAKPGQLNYTSVVAGGFAHIVGEAFKRAAGVDMVHVPYKGDAPALADAVAGHVPVIFNFPVTAAEFIKTGRLIGLMQTGERRTKNLPDVPTAAEAGLPQLTFYPFGGFWAPARTPPGLVHRLHAELMRVLSSQEYQDVMLNSGSEPRASTPEEFAAFIETERAKWTKVIRETGVRMDQ